MFTTLTAQVSTSTLLRPNEFLRPRSDSKDLSEAINTALEFWLDAKNELGRWLGFARAAQIPLSPGGRGVLTKKESRGVTRLSFLFFLRRPGQRSGAARQTLADETCD